MGLENGRWRSREKEEGKKAKLRVKLWEFAAAEKATSFFDGFRVGGLRRQNRYTSLLDISTDLIIPALWFNPLPDQSQNV